MHQLYVVPNPRTLVLVSETGNALLFNTPKKPAVPSQPVQSDDASVNIEMKSTADVNLDRASLAAPKVYGVLGLFQTNGHVFLSIVTQAAMLGNQAGASAAAAAVLGATGVERHGIEAAARVIAVRFVCVSSYDFDLIDPATGLTRVPEPEILVSMKKVLNNESFYYSTDPAYNIASRLTSEQKGKAPPESPTDAVEWSDSEDEEPCNDDSQYLWNSFLLAPFVTFEKSLMGQDKKDFQDAGFLVKLIQGYCGVHGLVVGGEPVVLSLISRLGSRNAGTRFNARGIDDDGNVANHVETEIILQTRTKTFSYVQLRGSVPVFWEEQGATPFNQKIVLTRPVQASLPVFLKHFDSLVDIFGNVAIVDLLSQKDTGGESALVQAYRQHLSYAGDEDENILSHVSMIDIDFHAKAKVAGIDSTRQQIGSMLAPRREKFQYTVESFDGNTPSYLSTQKGIFRTNCKDCLDRTNVVQDIVSKQVLADFEETYYPQWTSADERLWGVHRTLWAENGDALSKIYAGTGALNSSFTRSGQRSFAGLLSDATKSVNRMYQSNFADPGKQKAIDSLLGLSADSVRVRVFNPLYEEARRRVDQRASEFSSHENITLWCGSYNVNGVTPDTIAGLEMNQQSAGNINAPFFHDWLFPESSVTRRPTLVALALQELVPMSAQNMVSNDVEKRGRWEIYLNKHLGSDYILVRSSQLVGTAIFVFCERRVMSRLRNVDATTKKTGMKGIAGNKGAAAVRFDFDDTSFCFLSAHLAAGQSATLDRNADCAAINDTLVFSRGRQIRHHDNIVWMADTNYRIQGLPTEKVKMLIEQNGLDLLAQYDELSQLMARSRVFPGYSEGPLIFEPTYKYDNGTTTYDTSDKQRCPAWTDRIIFKGVDLDLNVYSRAELLYSDHRPVYSLMRTRVYIIDKAERRRVRQEALAEARVARPRRPAPAPAPGRPVKPNTKWWEPLPAFTEEDNVKGNPFEDAGDTGESRPPPVPPRIVNLMD